MLKGQLSEPALLVVIIIKKAGTMTGNYQCKD